MIAGNHPLTSRALRFRFPESGDARWRQECAPTGSAVERLFEIVSEDDDLLVINKQADLVCHPTKTDAYSSLIGRIQLYLGEGARPQLINRLDRETSGIVIVGKKAEAALALRRLWESGSVEKRYLAIVHGTPREPEGMIDACLGRDERSKVAIKDCVRPDGVVARTGFKLIRSFSRNGGEFSFLDIRPQNGRKHQIRIHLAHLGHPIVGDKLYGEDEDLYLALVEKRLTNADRARLILPNQALHAASVRFPWRGGTTVFVAEPEAWFKEFVPAGVTWNDTVSNPTA
jgi:23S rRNA pseudouridine1911/1915/1917 synthase